MVPSQARARVSQILQVIVVLQSIQLAMDVRAAWRQVFCFDGAVRVDPENPAGALRFFWQNEIGCLIGWRSPDGRRDVSGEVLQRGGLVIQLLVQRLRPQLARLVKIRDALDHETATQGDDHSGARSRVERDGAAGTGACT